MPIYSAFSGILLTAGSRTRTGTDVTPRDFKSLASANFAMPAQLLKERAGLLPSPTTLKGLEPSTSAVTGRRTNQLYHRAVFSTHPQNRTYKSNSTGQAGHSLSAPRPTSCHLILRCASADPSVCPCKHGLPSVPASCPPSSLLGQAFVRLVAVSSIHYCTSTPALSTSSSSRGLISLGGEVSSWRGLHA